MGGASLGGSLLSFQPTRTVSQFITQRARSTASQGSPALGFAPGDGLAAFLFGAPQANFTEVAGPSPSSLTVNSSLSLTQDWPSGMISLTNGQASLFATFSYERRDRDTTDFQAGHEADVKTAMVGIAFRVSQELILGLNGYYGETRGTLKGGGIIGADFTGVDVAINKIISKSFEQLCLGMPRNGRLRSTEWGASVFALAGFAGGGFLNAELGAAALDSSSSHSLCLVEGANTDDPVDVHRGIISGAPEGYRIDGKIRAGYDIKAGQFVIGPRAGVDAAWIRLGAYKETETPFGTTSPVDDDTNDLAFYNTTGAALAVREQDYTSVQSRLGILAALPIATNGTVVTPFVEGTYIHEFANDQRDIVARFVGDTRGAGATVFSFQTDAPDRDFFEISGGLIMSFTDATTAVIGGRTILGNDLYDSYTVEGSVRVPF
jgi:uncharacterized protein YhjY with autotransporter beta-barrel domain